MAETLCAHRLILDCVPEAVCGGQHPRRVHEGGPAEPAAVPLGSEPRGPEYSKIYGNNK